MKLTELSVLVKVLEAGLAVMLKSPVLGTVNSTSLAVLLWMM